VSCDGCGKSYPSYYNYTRLELKRFSAFLKVYHIVGRSYNAQSNAFSRKSEEESVIRGENVRVKISIHFSPAVIAKKFTTLKERQCLFHFFSTRHFQLEGCGLRSDGLYSCQYCSVRLPTLSGIKNHARMMVGGPYCSDSNILYTGGTRYHLLWRGVLDPRHFKRIRIQFLTVTDPDLALLQSDGNLRPLVYRPSRAPYFTLQASIISTHGPQWLYFEPLKLMYFDFNADPDPAFHLNANLDSYPGPKKNADLDPQPCCVD
jgi:hypothetical protein